MTGKTTYTDEIGQCICDAVANSQDGLRKTLAKGQMADGSPLPDYRTVQGWLRNHASFSMSYANAKLDQLRAMAEDIVDISRDETLDPNDKRIRIDTLKWLLSKLIPKTYGDKLDVTSDGQALAVPSHQIDARIQSIIMQAQARRITHVDGVEVTLDANALKLLD